MLPAQRNPDASWDWMLHDGLGSVRGVFDGTLQSAAEYDPFGEPIVAPIGTAYGFTGELTDDNDAKSPPRDLARGRKVYSECLSPNG